MKKGDKMRKKSYDKIIKLISNIAFSVVSTLAFCLILIFVIPSKWQSEEVFRAFLFGMPLSYIWSLLVHFIVAFVCRIKMQDFQDNKLSMSLSAALFLISIIVWFLSTVILAEVASIYSFIFYMFLTCVFWIGLYIYGFTLQKTEDKAGIIEKIFMSLPIISYELLLSNTIKNINYQEDKTHKARRSKIVIGFNIANLLSTIIIFILFYFMFEPEFSHGFFYPNIYSGLIFVRTIARSFEIIYAFLKDTMDGNNKKTNIMAYQRIFLAISSLFEITLLNALIYFTLGCIDNLKGALFFSFGISTLVDISLDNDDYLLCFFMAIQIITCLVLTLLTIARYVGEIKDGMEKQNENR